jgi:hypothetical protein
MFRSVFAKDALCAVALVEALATAGEYLSETLDKHLATVDTARRLTIHWHDTPRLNGIAERLNRTLVEKKRAGAAVYGRSSEGPWQHHCGAGAARV